MKIDPLETLNQITKKYIRDNLFTADPLFNLLRKDTNEWLIQNDPDPFETFVRETRAAAGITDPPRQPVCGGGPDPKPWAKSYYCKNYITYGSLDESEDS